MPYADSEEKKKHDRAYNKKWYAKNKEKVTTRVNEKRRENRAKWIEFKSTLSCTHCGFSHPAVIDFHHVVRDGTKLDVNRLIANNSFGRAYKEIEKCIPLCANCHRILHWNEHPKRNA